MKCNVNARFSTYDCVQTRRLGLQMDAPLRLRLPAQLAATASTHLQQSWDMSKHAWLLYRLLKAREAESCWDAQWLLFAVKTIQRLKMAQNHQAPESLQL